MVEASPREPTPLVWALDLAQRDSVPGLDFEANLVRVDVGKALAAPLLDGHGTLGAVVAHPRENDAQRRCAARLGGRCHHLVHGRHIPVARVARNQIGEQPFAVSVL